MNDNVCKIICAHPVKGHYIQGLKNMEEAIVPSIYNPEPGKYQRELTRGPLLQYSLTAARST